MLRSWGGPAQPCDLGSVSWASTTLSAKGKWGAQPLCSLCLILGMLPVGLLPAKDLPAPTEAPFSLGGA